MFTAPAVFNVDSVPWWEAGCPFSSHVNFSIMTCGVSHTMNKMEYSSINSGLLEFVQKFSWKKMSIFPVNLKLTIDFSKPL